MGELEGYNHDLATLIIGVDSLMGGDVMHESGTKHAVADTWTSGLPPPDIYNHEIAVKLRAAEGMDGVPTDDVAAFVTKHDLFELPDKLRDAAKGFEPEHRLYAENKIHALEVMLQTAVAMKVGDELPSYAERYTAATTLPEAHLIDPAPVRERLVEELDRVGYSVTASRTLRETVAAWESSRIIPKDVVTASAHSRTVTLMRDARAYLLPPLNEKIGGVPLENIEFQGHEFRAISNVFFTGSSIYRGGTGADGRPLLQGLLEYNIDHPVTTTGLTHLMGHEAVTGHWFSSAVADLLWREGRLPFETTMAVMCTPATAFQEGWAQRALHLLAGDTGVPGFFGPDMHVSLLLEDLQDIGKHNAAILYQRDGMPLERLRTYLADECVLSDPIVKKLSGGMWAQHPIFSVMYGPAYYVGAKTMQKGIEQYGFAAAARVGLQFGGLVDVETFGMKLKGLRNSPETVKS
jgi:hypothetical protein